MSELRREELKINKYFRKFVIKYCNRIGFDEIPNNIISEIKTNEKIDFISDWNYMTTLIILVEKIFEVNEILTRDNYVRFELAKNIIYQDKGMNKLDAFNNCIYHLLTEEWDEKKPFEYDSGESYLKEDYE